MTSAILAGGAASRMGGVDKANLSLNGRRIIERQIDVLRQVSDAIIVVGGPLDRFRDLNVRAVPDVRAGCGALGGIYSALRASTDPWTLVVACDMPFLSLALLQRLARPPSTEVDVVMPVTRDGPQPLCAVYAARCADAVAQRIDRGLFKVADLAEDVCVEAIGPEELATYDPDGLMFVNVNTPHDYERAKTVIDRMPGSGAALQNRITDAPARPAGGCPQSP
jgi:molybdopterin-guanine dinucleotide biosynthesis protein A